MNKHINLNGIYDENADMIPLYSERGRILGSISPGLFEDFNNIKEKLVVGEVVYTFNEYLQMSGNFIREIVSAVEGIGLHPNLALILMDAINLYEGGSIPLTEDNISNAIEAYYTEVGSGYLRLVEICNNPDLYTYGNISTRFTNEYNKINELEVNLDFEERFNLDKDLSITGGTNKTFMEKSFLVENKKEDKYVPNTNGEFELELEKQEELDNEEINLSKSSFLDNPDSGLEDINLEEEEMILEDNSHIVHDIEVVDSLSEEEVNVLLPKSANQLSKNTDDGEENFLSILSTLGEDSELSEETIKLDSSLVILEEEGGDWGKADIIVDSEEEYKTEKLNVDLELITKELVFTEDSDDEELVSEDEVPEIVEVPLEEDDEDSEIKNEDSLTEEDEIDLDIISEFGTELKTLPKIENTKGNVITSIHKSNEYKIKEESERELKPIEPFEPSDEYTQDTIKPEETHNLEETSTNIEVESKEIEVKDAPIVNNNTVDLPKEDTEKNNQDMLSMFERRMEEIITKTNEKHEGEVSRLNRKIEDLTKTIQVISEEKVAVKPVVEEPYVEVQHKPESIEPVKIEEKVQVETTVEKDAEDINVPIKPITPEILDIIVNVKPITPFNREEDYTRNNRLIKSAHESRHQIYENKIEEKMSGTNKPKKPAHYIDEEIGYVFKSSVKVDERKEVKSEGLNKLEQERREIARQVLSSRGEF